MRKYSKFISTIIFALCLGNTAQAGSMEWQQLGAKLPNRTSSANIVERQYVLFRHFLSNSLTDQSGKVFQQVGTRIKNRITWRNRRGVNIYSQAFHKSYRFVRRLEFKEMPEIVMLIPYMESLWEARKGHPSGDYGYWQMVPEVTEEIRQLDHAPRALKQNHVDDIRRNAYLSTLAARMHLRRYYFYFAKVAKFSETDAWLLSMISYNWGAGNTKRLIARMQSNGIAPNFSNFYIHLYQQHWENPNDISLRAAVEYLPGLWHIAKMLQEETR